MSRTRNYSTTNEKRTATVMKLKFYTILRFLKHFEFSFLLHFFISEIRRAVFISEYLKIHFGAKAVFA